MRLWHLVLAVLFAAIFLGIAREKTGQVALIVFFTGLGEILFGTTALMALFQTVAAIGHANRPSAYIEAVAATVLVLMVATLLMNGVLWIGAWLLQIVLAVS
jgi:hypothetical protein